MSLDTTNKLRSLIISSGALDFSKAESVKYTKLALNSFDKLKKDIKNISSYTFLEELILSLIQRDI